MRYRLHLLREETARVPSRQRTRHTYNTYVRTYMVLPAQRLGSRTPLQGPARAQMSRRQNYYAAILSPAFPSRPPRDRALPGDIYLLSCHPLGPAPPPDLARDWRSRMPMRSRRQCVITSTRTSPRAASSATGQGKAAEAPPPPAYITTHNASGGRQADSRCQRVARPARRVRRGLQGVRRGSRGAT